jgi:peptide/nickel transport system ATP-binding protein
MTAVSVKGAQVQFGDFKALNDVSVKIPAGSCFGIVGESGSGKTTLMRTMLGLQRLHAGEIRVLGKAMGTDAASRREQSRLIQPIFQDPAASLSPRCRIRTLMNEVSAVLKEPVDQTYERLAAILRRLGLPKSVVDKYPHEISGGQARRVAIARALLMRPSILMADEPTAGLDVSVQGELLNFLQDIRKSEQITLIVISHNLAIVRLIAESAAVMQRGQIVEQGDAGALFDNPQAQYTRELVASWPRMQTHA